jgi:hypothetical protein
MNALIDLSARQLRQAAQLRERIDELQSELSRLLGGSYSSARMGSPGGGGRRGRRHMSPATKAKLAAIARARWKQAKAQGKKAL